MTGHFYLAACADGDRAGIYTYGVSPAGEIRCQAFTPVTDINYLLLSPDGSKLWGTTRHGVATFRRTPAGELEQQDLFTPAGGGAHLALDPAGRRLYTAHYHSGRISEIRLEQGMPVELTQDVVSEGRTGPVADRQDAPHPHGVFFTPDHRFLAVPDLGLDAVKFYRRQDGGGIKPVPAWEIAAFPGSGPRHLVFSADGRYLYLLGELDSTISCYSCSAGRAEWRQTRSMLPPDFHDFSKAAAIRLSRDGRYLLGSNRGHDSLSIYRLEENGDFHLCGIDGVAGKGPRDFDFLPDGRTIVSTNEDSGSVTFFRFDDRKGRLLPGPPAIENLPRPLCIVSPPWVQPAGMP